MKLKGKVRVTISPEKMNGDDLHQWDSTCVNLIQKAETPYYEISRNKSTLSIVTTVTNTLQGNIIIEGECSAHGAWNSLSCNEDGVKVEFLDCKVQSTLVSSDIGWITLDEYLIRREKFQANLKFLDTFPIKELIKLSPGCQSKGRD